MARSDVGVRAVRTKAAANRLVLLVVLCLGGSAWSQTEVGALAAPCNAAPTILPQANGDCPETGARRVVIRTARVLAEAVLGAGLGALLGVIGAYAGLNIDLGNGREAGTGFGLGTGLGVTLGVAPGVWLAGYSLGGDGSVGWTVLGSALGTGISAGLLKLDNRPGMLAFASAIPVVSAIIAYELSSHFRRAKASAEPPPALTLAPTFGVGYVGLAGAF